MTDEAAEKLAKAIEAMCRDIVLEVTGGKNERPDPSFVKELAKLLRSIHAG